MPEKEGDAFLFRTSAPAIIQASEIKQIKVSLRVQIDEGFVLNIITHPEVNKKGIVLCPSLITLGSSGTNDLIIGVQNISNTQVNIMPGELIAKGFVCKTEDAELYQFEPQTIDKVRKPKSRPQKKNPDIEFIVE